MKIIDQTPFYKESGELSLIDRGKAILEYGTTWMKEVEAQRAILPVLDKTLDKNFTLLRNVPLPELDMSIPFILVGPTGVYVMYVTHLTGMFRAKGDAWGTIVGNTYKEEKPNLLIRTERMARAVQVYLQRQGFDMMLNVEAILLCADPSVHVDSLRPIIRVVMRDALERLAVSISQARVVLSPEAIQKVVNGILSPPKPEEEQPVPPPVDVPAQQEEEMEPLPVSESDLSRLQPEPPKTSAFTTTGGGENLPDWLTNLEAEVPEELPEGASEFQPLLPTDAT
ncbi:hypothetical protein EG831_10345, partial [bacterium]|nr:hypothetical protein [bacterium]